ERAGVLLIVNDHPHVALAAGADGVHVGQDDMPVAEARELVGADMLIGLSTHARQEGVARDAARADYIGVGPLHQTPPTPRRRAASRPRGGGPGRGGWAGGAGGQGPAPPLSPPGGGCPRGPGARCAGRAPAAPWCCARSRPRATPRPPRGSCSECSTRTSSMV